MIDIEIVAVGHLSVNCYIIGDNEQVVVIDPGEDVDDIIVTIGERKIKYILLTHGHYDHIGALNELILQYPDAEFALHQLENQYLKDPVLNLSAMLGGGIFQIMREPDLLFEDGDKLDFLDIQITVIHTPGHTVGGCCYLFGNALFTGDTLFQDSIGRTDFEGGNQEQLLDSIKNKLFPLPESTKVFPGHMSPTTIGHEKENNPFLD